MRSHLSVFAALLLPLFLCTSPAFGNSLTYNEYLVHDNDLNIDWIRYGNWMPDNNWTPEVILPQIKMTWSSAIAWVAELNKKNYGGFNNWHLPITPDGFYKKGDYTWEYNTNKFDTKKNVTFSDLGHLYYVDLGLSYNAGVSLSPTNTFPFQNLQADYYWFGTPSKTQPNMAWAFDFKSGLQFLESKSSLAYAIAVHSPEPASALLFLSGIAGTLWYLRRKKR